jgi:hypothetical protein
MIGGTSIQLLLTLPYYYSKIQVRRTATPHLFHASEAPICGPWASVLVISILILPTYSPDRGFQKQQRNYSVRRSLLTETLGHFTL